MKNKTTKYITLKWGPRARISTKYIRLIWTIRCSSLRFQQVINIEIHSPFDINVMVTSKLTIDSEANWILRIKIHGTTFQSDFHKFLILICKIFFFDKIKYRDCNWLKKNMKMRRTAYSRIIKAIFRGKIMIKYMHYNFFFLKSTHFSTMKGKKNCVFF